MINPSHVSMRNIQKSDKQLGFPSQEVLCHLYAWVHGKFLSDLEQGNRNETTKTVLSKRLNVSVPSFWGH